MNRHSRGSELFKSKGEERSDHITVNQKGFCSVTDTDPLGLRVHDDGQRSLNISPAINIDVAVSSSRFNNRDGGFFDDSADQARAASGNKNVDATACAHHRTCTLTSPGINSLDQVCRESTRFNRATNNLDKGLICRKSGASTAKNHGITRFKSKDRSIDSHVGTRLVDHADNAHRNADLGNTQTIFGASPTNNCSNRIFKANHVENGLRDRAHAAVIKTQTIDEASSHPLVECALTIASIRFKDLF